MKRFFICNLAFVFGAVLFAQTPSDSKQIQDYLFKQFGKAFNKAPYSEVSISRQEFMMSAMGVSIKGLMPGNKSFMTECVFMSNTQQYGAMFMKRGEASLPFANPSKYFDLPQGFDFQYNVYFTVQSMQGLDLFVKIDFIELIVNEPTVNQTDEWSAIKNSSSMDGKWMGSATVPISIGDVNTTINSTIKITTIISRTDGASWFSMSTTMDMEQLLIDGILYNEWELTKEAKDNAWKKISKPFIPITDSNITLGNYYFTWVVPIPANSSELNNYFKEMVDYFKLYEKKNQLKVTYIKGSLASFGVQDSVDIIMERQK